MDKRPPEHDEDPAQKGAQPPALAERVGASAARKLRAKRRRAPGVWSGLGMMGMIGWSIAVPTVLGGLLGWWLDRHLPGGRSWALALLVGGLTLGCFNAWRWVEQEQQAMQHEEDDDAP